MFLKRDKYFSSMFKANIAWLLLAGRLTSRINTYMSGGMLFIIISFYLILVPVSCKKVQDTMVPYVPVSFVVNLNIVNQLTVPGNSVFFPQYGYGGVIVYCELPGSYYAYDATCTYEVSRSCIVENEGLIAECPCCGSQFVLLGSAYPSEGPATMPLKQYNVSVVNNFEIRIYN